MSGITRSSSSDSVHGVEPGRVDIPPISMMSGLCTGGVFDPGGNVDSMVSILEMEEIAESMSRLLGDPSENESGVALNMAMINGVLRESRRNGEVVGMMGTSV